jgi:diguanylate cyclase (GGDEF)-like protein/PAS domain S-box-containing protein
MWPTRSLESGETLPLDPPHGGGTAARLDGCSVETLSRILDSISDAVFLLDTVTLQIVDVNQSACKLLDQARHELTGSEFLQFTAAKRQPSFQSWLDSLCRGEEQNVSIAMNLRRRDAVEIPVRLKLTRIERDGKTLFFVGAEDLNEQRILAELTRVSAHEDYLTGLSSRGAVEHLLRQVAESSQASGNQFGVMFIDLDNFKQINDQRGHVFGDEVLRIVAERLKHAVRPDDIVARYGGDEFLVLVADCHDELAHRIAERITASLGEPIQIQGGTVHVSASVGVALSGESPVNIDRLIEKADQEMYRAKRAR